jgi:3-oxoacyl-(acyl-carrier-protein) synthase
LAGAGALEAVITIAALLHQSDWGASGERPRTSMHYAMSNSFGFGGNNVSLVFARGKADG